MVLKHLSRLNKGHAPELVLATMLLVILVGTVVGESGRYKEAMAQSSGGTISGYAWSDNIGWISMNGSGYGISVSSGGTLSGYAWSDNVGWISANSANLSGCPSGPCSASIDGDGNLQGWLKAVAGNDSQSGGWDGFVSLSGSGYRPTRQSDGSFSGYAWGDLVVGWLDFSYASTDYLAEPSAELKVRKIGDTEWVDGLTIENLEEIELAWNQDGTANTSSCEAVPPTYGFNTDSEASGTDSDVEEPVGNTSYTYRLLCYGENDTQKVDSVTVDTIGGVGAQFCPGTEVDFVHRGTDVTLCWELGTNEPSLCSITAGSATVLSPLPSVEGTTTHLMLGEVEFTLSCVGGDSDTMRVRVLPDIQET